VDNLVLVDKVEAGQSHDAVATERSLEREIEARQRLDGGQPSHLQSSLYPPSLAQGDLLGEQDVDRLEGAELAALELLDDTLERFKGARHAQADQIVAYPLNRILRHGRADHAAAPLAKRLPTAS